MDGARLWTLAGRLAYALLIPIQADVADSIRTVGLPFHDAASSAIRRCDLFALRLAAARP